MNSQVLATADAQMIEEFREAFVYFDSDDNGRIRISNLGIAMRALGAAISQAELHKIVQPPSLLSKFLMLC